MHSGFLPIGMALFGPLAYHMSLRLLMVVSSAILVALSLKSSVQVSARMPDSLSEAKKGNNVAPKCPAVSLGNEK